MNDNAHEKTHTVTYQHYSRSQEHPANVKEPRRLVAYHFLDAAAKSFTAEDPAN